MTVADLRAQLLQAEADLALVLAGQRHLGPHPGGHVRQARLLQAPHGRLRGGEVAAHLQVAHDHELSPQREGAAVVAELLGPLHGPLLQIYRVFEETAGAQHLRLQLQRVRRQAEVVQRLRQLRHLLRGVPGRSEVPLTLVDHREVHQHLALHGRGAVAPRKPQAVAEVSFGAGVVGEALRGGRQIVERGSYLDTRGRGSGQRERRLEEPVGALQVAAHGGQGSQVVVGPEALDGLLDVQVQLERLRGAVQVARVELSAPHDVPRPRLEQPVLQAHRDVERLQGQLQRLAPLALPQPLTRAPHADLGQLHVRLAEPGQAFRLLEGGFLQFVVADLRGHAL